jgi:glycine betaine catabolism B
MLKLKSVNFEQQEFHNHELEATAPGQLEWLIGRKNTCDIVLPCPEVSRTHGRIVYSEEAYHFVDLGSTSGSLLNGELIPHHDQRILHPGDLLQLGKTFLHVEELTPPAIASTAQIPSSTWTTGDLYCRCQRIVDETPDVKTFYFVAEPPVLFNYRPGQFVTLELSIAGERVLRPYSLSSSPSRPHHLSITVKRVPAPANHPDLPPGLVSNWLQDNLQVGDRIKLIGGPMGHFSCLPDQPEKMLLLSAGSGITPMMSMARWLQDTLADCDIIFFHSARTLEDIVFRNELSTMATQMPNFRLAVTVTQKPTYHPWMGLTGRLSESMLQLVAPDLRDRTVYVCGPTGFMQHTRSLLTALKFPMQFYQEESFGSPPAPSQTAPQRERPIEPGELNGKVKLSANGKASDSGNSQRDHHTDQTDSLTLTGLPTTASTYVVSFARSQQNIATDGSSSLLELAEQAGIMIPSACRAGACGACKVQMRQGKVRYETSPTALTTTDHQAGCVLACVAYPDDHLKVEA